MPKRKRAEDELEEKLVHHRTELFRKLKAAKGFERQRMAKRQRDPKSTADKRARIDKEIVVLKSLDLQSVAHAHLCASLLKIKAITESPQLPESVKNGVPKPEITEEERAALHNVTSGLYNQPKVREALDRAVADICRALHVPVPDKKGKPKKSDKTSEGAARRDPEEQPADRNAKQEPGSRAEKKAKREDVEGAHSSSSGEDGPEDDETEWNGISDDEVDEKAEQVISKFDDRLGGSDEDEYDTANEELDPMEITDISASEQSEDEASLDGSESEDESPAIAENDESEEDESEDEESDSSGISPPPKARKDSQKSTLTRSRDTHFLPTLMGGYISGSDSEASDIDVAPPTQKNRRGQRARQAIWEKKFKDKAKHLAKQQQSGRDAGWDLKRGAIDGSERTPWKKGIRTPFEKRSAPQQQEHYQEPRRPKAPTKKDDEGPLHPSWEARKKAKEAQETATFAGKRVVFD